jgi:hypothetical protein
VGTILRQLHLILTITCGRASQLTSDSFERKLLRHERWALKIHKLSCWSCRQFERQLHFVRNALQRIRQREQLSLDQGEKLDPAFKQQLKQLKL